VTSPPIDTFELETAAGFRRLVFDFDVFRGRDVRVLVDGDEVARMPAPTADSPRQEVSLSVEGHPLLAVAEARNRGALMVYDLFHDDRSLKNGATLDQARAVAPAPAARRPPAHGIVEGIIQIAPAAGGSGMGVGVVSGIDRLGWPMTVLLLATGLGALWLGSAGARLVWNEILRRRGWSERRQSIVGLAGVIATFVVAYGAWFLVVLVIAQRSAAEF
jgi:hypothetical protein